MRPNWPRKPRVKPNSPRRRSARLEKLEALAKAEAAERVLALAAEQKAERDARYAARKAAKKVRRRGY